MAPIRPIRAAATVIAVLALAACSTTGRTEPYPSEAEAMLRAAEDALSYGRLSRAEDALRAARHTEPPAPPQQIAMLQAAIHIERGRFDQARQALAQVPPDPGTHELEARIALYEGRFDEAHRSFRELARRASSPAAARRLTDLAALADGFEQYADGRYSDAVTAWSRIEDSEVYASLSRAIAGESRTAAVVGGEL